MKERLHLTDAQATEVRPIMKESAEQRLAIMNKRRLKGREDVKRLSLFQKMSLGREMKKVRDETDERLSRVLTKVQIKEFRRMRDELKQEQQRRM